MSWRCQDSAAGAAAAAGGSALRRRFGAGPGRAVMAKTAAALSGRLRAFGLRSSCFADTDVIRL